MQFEYKTLHLHGGELDDSSEGEHFPVKQTQNSLQKQNEL